MSNRKKNTGYDENLMKGHIAVFKKNPIDAGIDAEITKLLEDMSKIEDKTSDKYSDHLDMLSQLHELRQKNRLSPDVMANVAANIAGILLVIGNERVHVITTKALSLVKKIV